MKSPINNNIEISDLGATASLITNGFKLHSLDRTNKKRVLFYFENSPELQQALREYFSFDLQGDCQTLFNAIKSLKCQIYSDNIGFDIGGNTNP